MKELEIIPVLNKNEIQKIINGDSTIYEFNKLKPLINERTNYIVRKIVEISNLKLDWWDFDNLNQHSDENGFFDPIKYKNHIEIVANLSGYSYKKETFDVYLESFPVEFLWEDFELSVTQQFNNFKKKIDEKELLIAQQIIKEKEKLQQIIDSVKSKITPEELAYIQFVTPRKSKKNR